MLNKRLLPITFLLILLFLLSGCGSSFDLEPRVIDPTLDDCPVCRMSIIDLRFAGQVINNLGQHENFDDIGCLILYLKRLGLEEERSLGAIYVKDFATTEWAPAKEAFYVQGRIDTPMSFGIVAFKSQEQAEEMAQKIEGKIISWEEVKLVKFDIGFGTETETGGVQSEGEVVM